METNDPPILAARIFSSLDNKKAFPSGFYFFSPLSCHWGTKKVRIRTIFSLQNDFFFDINISLF
jgi:hypothetical protein